MDASGRDLHRRDGRVKVVPSRSERSDDGGEGRDLEYEGDDGQEKREPALPVRVADEPDDVEDAGERQEPRKESERVVGRLKGLCDDSEAAQVVWMQGEMEVSVRGARCHRAEAATNRKIGKSDTPPAADRISTSRDLLTELARGTDCIGAT